MTLFLILAVSGIVVADRSMNRLINNEQGLQIIALRNQGSYLEFSFMNYNVYFNVENVLRDFNKLKSMAEGLWKNIGIG